MSPVLKVCISRAGEPELEPELGAPEPNIFLGAGAGAGALICICCGAGAGAGAMNETTSSSSEWLKNLTKKGLHFLDQNDHLNFDSNTFSSFYCLVLGWANF